MSVAQFMGRQLSLMSREDLMQAVEHLARQLDEANAETRQVLDTWSACVESRNRPPKTSRRFDVAWPKHWLREGKDWIA